MTEQEKELLLKDLCGRLPYGVKAEVETTDGNGKEIKDEGVLNSVFINEYGATYICIEGMEYELEGVKPYFRTMPSMTEDEKIELKEYLDAEEVDCDGFGYIEGGTLEDYVSRMPYSLCNYVIDWLNAHHFDHRGLIGMGLAIEAPEGMYEF